MKKAQKVYPISKEGLGTTYHSQADSPHDVWNKWNWKCTVCGNVYLNRYSAIQCCKNKKEEKNREE